MNNAGSQSLKKKKKKKSFEPHFYKISYTKHTYINLEVTVGFLILADSSDSSEKYQTDVAFIDNEIQFNLSPQINPMRFRPDI